MPLARQSNYLSVPHYLAGERTSEIRHEYVDGLVYAMAGASVNHNQITANMLTSLKIQLKGSNCRPFSSDLLVKTGSERYRYPDVVVVCNNQFLDDYSTDSPIFIVEVLSKATRQSDRQAKRLEYLQLSSLQEYMLIEQDSVEVEVFRRNQGWQPSYYYWGDTIQLESIKVTICVEDIYELVANEDVERFLKEAQQKVNP